MTTGRTKGERPTDQWKFCRDESNKWRWKYIMQGKAAAQAYRSFAQYEDCVDDARSHGYRGERDGRRKE